MNKTTEMKIIDNLMTALDDERWGENSGNELSYILSQFANFTDASPLMDIESDDEANEFINRVSKELRWVDVGDKYVAVEVYTIDKPTLN